MLSVFKQRLPLLILFILSICIRISAADSGDITKTTVKEIFVESAGIGSEFQQEVEEAGNLIADNNFKLGKEKVLLILQKFQDLLIEDDVIYISVSSDAQYEDFIKNNPEKKIRRTSWELQKILFLKAFLAVENNDLDGALNTLDSLLKIAPYSSSALCEQGYLLNRKQEYEKSLQSYQKAAELAQKFSTEKHNLPISLRGAGYALTKLKKYRQAKDAYTASLKYDANNPIALNGIANIESIEIPQ